MDALRQYFWLWIVLAVVFIHSAVGLALYLMYRRIFKANQHDGENINKDVVTLRNPALPKASGVHTTDNTYQLNDEHDYENPVSKSDCQDSTSHDYELPPDVEPSLAQDYINIVPDDYDDVVVSECHNEDYDDIEAL
ncbi:uncharacterized protein LOC144606396 [Rhinoraja longicauda]